MRKISFNAIPIDDSNNELKLMSDDSEQNTEPKEAIKYSQP